MCYKYYKSMSEIVRFKGQFSKWTEGRKIICVPTALTEMIEEYHGKKILVRIETIEDD